MQLDGAARKHQRHWPHGLRLTQALEVDHEQRPGQRDRDLRRDVDLLLLIGAGQQEVQRRAIHPRPIEPLHEAIRDGACAHA